MAGTPCPFMGQIGDKAKEEWQKNIDKAPEGAMIRIALADKSNRIDEEYPH